MSLPDSAKDLFLALGVVSLSLGMYYFLLWLANFLSEVTYG